MDLATGIPVGRVAVGPWRVSVVSIDALADRMAAGPDLAPFFGAEERARIAGFAVAKRRREWAAGRLAAKDAVARLRRGPSTEADGIAPADLAADLAAAELAAIVVGSREDEPHRGQPVAGAGEHVSISHSHGLAVAVASRSPVGVDVERVRPFPAPARESAFTERERRRVEGAPAPVEEAHHTVVWTFKEAFMKAHGLGVFGAFADLELEDVALDGRLSWRLSPDLARRLGEDGPGWCGFAELDGGYAISVVGQDPGAARAGGRP
jgi:4'-phosphopantetheinyl transferase EntD